MKETEKLEKLKQLGDAIQYLRTNLQLIGGHMVGEANRCGGLDFYKWRKIIKQLSANADLISEGKPPLPVEFRVNIDDILGRNG